MVGSLTACDACVARPGPVGRTVPSQDNFEPVLPGRNGKQLTRCNTCRGKPPDGAKQTSAASPFGALAGANAMIDNTKEVDIAEDKLINHFAERYPGIINENPHAPLSVMESLTQAYQILTTRSRPRAVPRQPVYYSDGACSDVSNLRILRTAYCVLKISSFVGAV